MALQFIIIQADSLIAVDNSAIAPLSLTGLAANIGQVSFQKDGGKLQYNDRPPVPVEFTDPAPYQPYINTWMTAAAALELPLQLAQAKQVKKDLIRAIFHHKHHAPFSSGGYLWDAGDEAVANVGMLLTQGTGAAGTGLVDQVNSTFSNINTWSVKNNTNWSNIRYDSTSGALSMLAAPPAPGSGAALVGQAGGTANIPMTPLGASAPVNFSTGTIGDAYAGIAGRRNTLNNDCLGKQAAVEALTTIPAIVAYDATTGWSF